MVLLIGVSSNPRRCRGSQRSLGPPLEHESIIIIIYGLRQPVRSSQVLCRATILEGLHLSAQLVGCMQERLVSAVMLCASPTKSTFRLAARQTSSLMQCRSNRAWKPNVQQKRLFSEILDEMIRIPVTTQALRTMDKVGGLDNYVLGLPRAQRPEGTFAASLYEVSE